nr:iron-containing alcohol dehydrogenase [Eubacterium sp.]
AVIMPKWMRYVLEINPGKLVQYATRVWDVEPGQDDHETALKGIECFEKFLKEIGMPANFDDIGARAEDIPAMTDKLLSGSSKTEGNYVKLKREDVIKIYESAL